MAETPLRKMTRGKRKSKAMVEKEGGIQKNTKPCEFVASLWPWPVGCSSHPSEESIHKLTLTAHVCSDVTCDQRIFLSWGGHFPNPGILASGNGAGLRVVCTSNCSQYFFFLFF
ncbi:hypothetical protein S83_032959 [Arachis hypogaea]